MHWTAQIGRRVESRKDLLCLAHEILIALLHAPLTPGAEREERELAAFLLLVHWVKCGQIVS